MKRYSIGEREFLVALMAAIAGAAVAFLWCFIDFLSSVVEVEIREPEPDGELEPSDSDEDQKAEPPRPVPLSKSKEVH